MPPRGTTNAAEGQNAQLQNQNRQAGQQLHINQPLEANRQEPVEVNQMILNMEARQQAIQQRELRTQQFLAQNRILMPKKTIVNKSLPQVSTEIRSASKRRVRAKMPGSALRRKNLNAQEVEYARQQWEEELNRRKQEAAVDLEGMSFLEQNAICQFLTEDTDRNRSILHNINNGRHFEARVGQECVRQFMALDFNLDLRDDKAFAAQSLRLEEIAGKTDAMKLLMKTHPDFLANLSEEEREELDIKMSTAARLRNYYQIQRKIITNPYYRTHYRSEISVRYSENDTLEQKNLVILQQQAEFLRTRKELTGSGDLQRALFRYKESERQGENTRAARQFLRQHESLVEYGKNNRNIENSAHAMYFRQHNHPGDPVYDRLSQEHYRVSGMNVEMNESFVRHLSNLPRWKAVQNTPLQQIDAMIQNLIRRPADDADEAQVEACKQSNLEGLRQFKELMWRQMGYLKRKYGCGFLFISPQEIAQHTAEFENDFTNMQGLSQLVIYMKQLPGLFREDDPFDQELDRLVTFYQSGCMAEGMARNMFAGDPANMPTYADYKFRAAYMSVNGDDIAQAEIDIRESMHLDIRWNTTFDLSFESARESLLSLNLPQVREELKRLYTPEETRRLTWNMLFVETKGQPRAQLARNMVEKATEDLIRTSRQEWRDGGFTFGGITYPGIGTDDFVFLNDLYRSIGADENMQAGYGITTPEIQAEYMDFLRQCENAGEAIRTTEAYANQALEMRDSLQRDSRGLDPTAAALCNQLAGDLNRAADYYSDQGRDYRRGEGSDIFTRFAQFRERIGMWTFPEHIEVMEQTVEPEIARQETDASITVSGIEARIFKDSEASVLDKKNLKEGTDPAAFHQALTEFNQEYARFRVLKRIVDAGETADGQENEPLWHAVRHKRGFFQFDVYNRLSTCYERWNRILNQLKDMTE